MNSNIPPKSDIGRIRSAIAEAGEAKKRHFAEGTYTNHLAWLHEAERRIVAKTKEDPAHIPCLQTPAASRRHPKQPITANAVLNFVCFFLKKYFEKKNVFEFWSVQSWQFLGLPCHVLPSFPLFTLRAVVGERGVRPHSFSSLVSSIFFFLSLSCSFFSLSGCLLGT